MKKLLVLSAMAALAFNAMGQGQIQFANRETSVTGVDARIYLDVVGVGGVGALGGNAYRGALVGGPTTSTAFTISGAGVSGGLGMNLLANPVSGVTWATFRTGTTAGYLVTGSESPRVVPGVDWGGTGLFQIVAWSGNYATFDAAIAAALQDPSVKIGASAPLTLTLPAAATSPNLTYLVGIQPFAIVSVPEPSTFALAGLGAAALMIFRRRK